MLTQKDEWERAIFLEFATSTRLAVDAGSVTSGMPPQPDIRFTADGEERWTELVEITDQALAKSHMTSLKTAAFTGGAFSQREPLVRAIRSKSAKSYATRGSPLSLLAYYDKQFPANSVEEDLIPRVIGEFAREMVTSGVWTNVWVYDTWSRKVLWALSQNTVQSPSSRLT